MKTNGNKVDYKMRAAKCMIITVLFIFAGLLVIGQRNYSKEQGRKSCYVDSSAFEVRSYMLYGKVFHDSGYVEKCIVKK